MIKRKKLDFVKVGIAAVTLVSISVLSLAFCQTKSTKTTASSAQASTVESKKVAVANPSSSKEKVKQKVKGKESTEQNQASMPASSSEISKEGASVKATGIDVQALAKGDFSSVAGTWSTYQGGKLVFDKNGVVALGDLEGVSTHVTLSTGSVSDKRYTAGIGEAYKWGAGISFIPEGVPTEVDKIIYQQDCIIIFQSVNGEYEPYYKVSDSTDVPEISPTDAEKVEEEPSGETENKTDGNDTDGDTN